MAKAKTPRTKDSTSNKQVITMPEAGTVPAVRKIAAPSNPTPIDLDDQIRRRAYEIYQERGGTPGQEHEDWLMAEREIRGVLARSQSA